MVLKTAFICLFASLACTTAGAQENIASVLATPSDPTISTLERVVYAPQMQLQVSDGGLEEATGSSGAAACTLRTRNTYRQAGGCYLNCYARAPQPGSCNLASGALVGIVRVRGGYSADTVPQCVPKDMSAHVLFNLCAQSFADVCGAGQCLTTANAAGWLLAPR